MKHRLRHREPDRVAPRPSVAGSLLFVALASGPPKLRVRDPEASLRGEVDWAVMVQLAVWLAGFAWVCYQLAPHLLGGRIPKPSATQVLGAMLIASLSLSLTISPSFALTGFSLFQFATMLGFAWLWVRRYGTESYLLHLSAGLGLLILALPVAWLVSPELVMKGATRLRGDEVAPAGAVAALGLILVLSGVPRMGRSLFLVVVALLLALLAASQTRTAYIAFALFLLMGGIVRSRLPIRKALPLAVVLMMAGAMLDWLPDIQQFVIRDYDTIGTMSGRIPLWTFLATTVLEESPLVGLGYYAASRVWAPQQNEALGNAHSAFVEVLVGGGLIASVIFLVLLSLLAVYAVRIAWLARGNRFAIAGGGLFLASLFFSLTGSEGIHAGPVGFVFWSLTALLPVLWLELRGETASGEDADRTVGRYRPAISRILAKRRAEGAALPAAGVQRPVGSTRRGAGA